MNRCLLATLIAAPLLGTALPCAAQASIPEVHTAVSAAKAGQRTFPHHAQFGVLRMEQTPHAQINSQAIRTAPGFRLFNADNKLIFAHTVQNQELHVAFVKESNTHWLLTAWILTPEEWASATQKR